MKKNKKIIDLVKIYKVNDIEKHLIFAFLNNKNLDYKRSSIISSYLSDFEINDSLISEIESIKVLDLKKLENYLELLIPPEDRKVNGAFFTPNYIVDFIIKETKPTVNSKCLDPSCGCGAFLIGLVEFF